MLTQGEVRLALLICNTTIEIQNGTVGIPLAVSIYPLFNINSYIRVITIVYPLIYQFLNTMAAYSKLQKPCYVTSE